MSEIIPAILPANPEVLREQVDLIDDEVNFIHLDVLEHDVWDDMHVGFEAHLMVEDPDAVAVRWLERGAQRLIVHKLTDKIKGLRPEVELGLAVDFHIPLSEIWPLVPDVDFIQLMSIKEVGRQGIKFEQGIFDRIKQVKEKFPEAVISVDGGINLENADDLMRDGVERLVIGSAIFASSDPHEALEHFLYLS